MSFRQSYRLRLEIPVRNSNDPDMPLGANYYTVKIGGQVLVSTKNCDQLQCVAREEKVNQSDIEDFTILSGKRRQYL